MLRSFLPTPLALLLCLPAVAGAVTCPPTTYLYGSLDPSTPIVVNVPSHDTTFSIQPCDRVHGRAQVPAGLLIAAVDYACAAGGSYTPSGIETIVDDEFTVTGLAPGTPVVFDAVLDLDGYAASFSEPGGGGGGRVRGIVHAGPTSESSVMLATNGLQPEITLHQSLVLSVSGTAGTPIPLRFSVRSEAFDGRATMRGGFRFANLPAGASVLSCRGYSSDAPVRARAATWGALKVRYR